MPIETIMPCLGTVDACVRYGETPTRGGCCPEEEQENGRILSSDAAWQVDFEIEYEGVLFDLIDSSENWNIEVWLENMGGVPDNNYQEKATIAHVQTDSPTTLNGSISIPWGTLTAGAVYRQVFKVEFNVNGNLLVCAFSEGKSFHVREA